jgi:hypothetical protein
MIRLIARLFRPRRRVLDLPALCPRQFTLDEVRAALSGHREDPKVQAILQILAMTRSIYLEQAQKAAQAGGTTHYDHGGMAAIEDTLAEVFNTLNSQAPSDELKVYFPNT